MPPEAGRSAVGYLGWGWGWAHHQNAGLLPVHEAFGNGVCGQDLIA